MSVDFRNLTRWVHASLASYYKARFVASGFESLIEGIEQRDDAFEKADDKFEFRVNGPYMFSPNDIVTARVFVNILITSNMGRVGKNKYVYFDMLGVAHEATQDRIPILRCGDGDADDGSTVGCLRIITERSLGVRVINFSQIDPTDRVKQGMVTASFDIDLF